MNRDRQMASVKKDTHVIHIIQESQRGMFIHSLQTQILCAYFQSYVMLDGRDTKIQMMHKS